MKPFDKMKRKPPRAEDLAEELRKRVQLGNLTFNESEVGHIADVLEKLSYRCAEAYQVVGSLAADAGCKEDPAVVKAMDLLFQPLRQGEMLPFATPKDRARLVQRQRLVKKAKAAVTGKKPKAAVKVKPASKRDPKKVST